MKNSFSDAWRNGLFFQRVGISFFVLSIVFSFLRTTPEYIDLPGFKGSNPFNDFVFVAFLMAIIVFFQSGFLKTDCKKIMIVWLAFVLWNVVCLFAGFWRLPVEIKLIGIPSLEKILNVFSWDEAEGLGDFLAGSWIFLRALKQVLFDSFFMGVVVGVVLFWDNFKRGFYLYKRAFLCLSVVLIAYGLVEMLSTFFHVNMARSFVIFVNSHIFDVASNHGWWPPLLWPNQLRSLTEEPSHLGVTMCFCVPVIWGAALEANNKTKVFFYVLLMFLACCLVWLTQSRTATIGLLIEVFILCFLGLFLCFKSRESCFLIVCQIVSVVISFWVSVAIISGCGSNSCGANANSYIGKNITSVLESNTRSNSARLENLLAFCEVAKKHPIFGVGKLLTAAYVNETDVIKNSDNYEIRKLWLKGYDRDLFWVPGHSGIVHSLNYIGVCAASCGFVGLFVFLFIPLYVIFMIFKKFISRKKIILDEQIILATLVANLILLNAATYGLVILGYTCGLASVLLCSSTRDREDATDCPSAG